MSYAARQINLLFRSSAGVLELNGLQVSAVINLAGGTQCSARLQMHIWGMTLQQMDQYSSVGSQLVAVAENSVTVMAGNQGAPMSNAFEGTIYRAFMDFSSIPNVAFVVSGVAGLYQRALPSVPNQYAGPHAAENIIATLAQRGGFLFVNAGGAHAILRDQYVYGSVVQQIEQVAAAAGFPVEIAKGTVTIWPNLGFRDTLVIPVNASLGMVGYPTYYEAGFIVKTQYNPDIEMGRQIQLASTIPKANGLWPVQTVTHELSTQQQGGPWFTTARLAPPPYVAQN